MKSSFLLVLTLLCSTTLWGQTRTANPTRKKTVPTKKAAPPARKTLPQSGRAAPQVRRSSTTTSKKNEPVKTTVTTETVSKTEIANKTAFEKFSDKLKIGYFGAYSGSSIGQWDTAALDEGGTKSRTYVHNLWNQISFNYNFGWKMNFVINPRFTLNTGSTSYHAANGNGLFNIEDTLVGIQGVVYSSDDKKFNIWTRPGLRLPHSRGSRAADITYQPENLANITYDFNKQWQLGAFSQLRWWVYEDRFNSFRYRVYTAPYIQYAVTDKDKIALWYENYTENRSRLESINGKKPKFEALYQTAMVSYARDITPKINFMPFIAYYLDTTYATERPLDPAWVGFWLSIAIK